MSIYFECKPLNGFQGLVYFFCPTKQKLMSRTVFKTIRFATAFTMALFFVTSAFAQEAATTTTTNCDTDGDGFIVISSTVMKDIDSASVYNENGNYSALQWQSFFNSYKANQDSVTVPCENLNFKVGAEPVRCDPSIISPASGVYDTSKVSTVAGTSVNPNAFDNPGDGIDQNCDGPDGQLLAATTGKTQNLEGLVSRSISLLSRAVVLISIVIMIVGGILYATAAGDEQKTAKARKTIVGAIIGLIVGLLAPTIIAYITASLV